MGAAIGAFFGYRYDAGWVSVPFWTVCGYFVGYLGACDIILNLPTLHAQVLGERLRAGQIVTTGSYAGALEVPLATPLTVVFGTLGTMHVTLDPAR